MALFRRRRWPWAVAAVGVLAAVAVAVVLLTRGGGGDADRGPGAAIGEVTESPDPVADATLPPSELRTLLTAPDARLRTYVDTELTAEAVPVQSVVGPDSVWIGESAADRVLLVLVSTETTFTVKPGDRVSFTGTVRPLTPEFAKLLGAQGDDLAELTRQAAYVEVTQYRTA